jgi:3-hydroxyacyl-CoA dehydrogenase
MTPVQRIGAVGGGQMGVGMAEVCALTGQAAH